MPEVQTPVRTRANTPPAAILLTPPRKISKSSVRNFTLRRIKLHQSLDGRQPIWPRTALWSVLRGLFGKAAWYLGPGAMGLSARHLRSLCAVNPNRPWNQPSLDSLRSLARWAGRMPAIMDEWRAAQYAAIDEEYERRKLEIAGAVTQLRLLTIERERAIEARELARANARVQKKARERAERGYDISTTRRR